MEWREGAEAVFWICLDLGTFVVDFGWLAGLGLGIGLGSGLGLDARICKGGEGGEDSICVSGGVVLPVWWRGGERGRGIGEEDSSPRPCENFPGFCPRTMKQGDILENMK